MIDPHTGQGRPILICGGNHRRRIRQHGFHLFLKRPPVPLSPAFQIEKNTLVNVSNVY